MTVAKAWFVLQVHRSLGKLLAGDRDHHGHVVWVKAVKERQRLCGRCQGNISGQSGGQ